MTENSGYSCRGFCSLSEWTITLIMFDSGHFGTEGYYVSTIGLNETTVKKYIAE